mmetsp:Transcript_20036/g.35090  ORF Transcript_20036/g.35090 Transcript_20036/m.35090 type:complete len:265 (-) Transcript_20036:20-814(-)
MLTLVIAHVHEHVVQRRQLRTALTELAVLIWFWNCAEEVEQEWIVFLVVLSCNRRDGHLLELVLILRQKAVVRIISMILNELRQMVRCLLGEGVDADDIPVVEEGHRLCERPVDEARVAAKRLHDEQMVELVVGLGVVRAHALTVAGGPFTERLLQVHHREVGEVRHARHRLQDVEPRGYLLDRVLSQVVLGVDEADGLVHRVHHKLVELVHTLVEHARRFLRREGHGSPSRVLRGGTRHHQRWGQLQRAAGGEEGRQEMQPHD